MKRALALPLLVLLGPALAAEETLTLTLPQALELAERQNVDVAQARLDMDRFHSRYRQALGSGLPSLDFSGTYTRNYKLPVIFFGGNEIRVGEENVFAAGASVEQPLFTGGKVARAVRGARRALSAQEAGGQGVRDEVALAVRRIFYGALLAEQGVVIQRENVASAEKHLATIRERYNQGMDSDLVLRRQEVEVANARANLISAKNLYETALLNLKEALSLDMDRPLALDGVFDPLKDELPDYDALAKAALDNRPEAKSTREMAAAYKEAVGVAAAEHWPQLSAFGNYQWTAQSDKLHVDRGQDAESLNAGLALRFSAFRGGQTSQQVKQARLDYEQAELLKERTERRVKREVREKWLALKEAFDRASVEQSAVGQAKRVLEATEVRYNGGEASQLELNDARFAFNRARLSYVQAQHDYWVSAAALERAAGARVF